MDIKEKISEGAVLAKVIIEVLGSPKEYVEETLKKVVENIKTEKFEVLKEELFNAQQQEKMFSAFTELEVLFKNNNSLIDFCFDYTPSSIDIIEPIYVNYKAHDFSNLLNDLLARIHKSDMALKNYNAENQILKKNAANLLQNLIILSLKNKEKDIKGLSKEVGIPVKQLEPLMEKFINVNLLRKENNNYFIKNGNKE